MGIVLQARDLDAVLSLRITQTPTRSWWQEIRVSNSGHQDLAVEVIQPAGRKIQIQMWEN